MIKSMSVRKECFGIWQVSELLRHNKMLVLQAPPDKAWLCAEAVYEEIKRNFSVTTVEYKHMVSYFVSHTDKIRETIYKVVDSNATLIDSVH